MSGQSCRRGGQGLTSLPLCHLPCLFCPQLEVDLLKAENDRLKVAPGPSSGCTPGQVPGSSALSSPRRSLGLALSHPFSPSLTDTGTSLRRVCVGRKREGSLAILPLVASLSWEVVVLNSVPSVSRSSCYDFNSMPFERGSRLLFVIHKKSLFGKENNCKLEVGLSP